MPTTPVDPKINTGLVALMLGVSSVQVSSLKKQVDNPLPFLGKNGREFLFDIHAVHEWDVRRRIHTHYRGSKTDEEDTEKVVDFHTEKTRLTSAQADKIELDNLVRQGQLADMSVLEEVLSNFGNIVRAGLDSIPAEIKRKCPHVDQATIDEIETVISTIRNSLNGESVSLPRAMQEFEDDIM